MCKGTKFYPTRFILIFFVLFVSVLTLSVNHVEASQPENSGLSYQVCQNFDIVYVLDLSGSMSWGYGGVGSRLDAAKEAIVQMNNVLEEDGTGVEAALLTWQGLSTNLAVNFTNDFDSISAALGPLSAGGGTPTAQALYSTLDVVQANVEPGRIPIVLFITDGIPTYDLDGYGYWDYYVNDVPIINPSGGYYSSNSVRYQGAYYRRSGRHAGYPLADAMEAVQALDSGLGDGVIHSISILGTDFRQDLLHYAADVGGGEYFGASNANQLAAAIQQSVYLVDCPSSLQINVDNTLTFTLGGDPMPIDPNLTVTGENEDVSSAFVQIADSFDSNHDALYLGDTVADSGVYNGFSWWYESSTGTLEVIGVASPETYQALLRDVRYANSAIDSGSTNMNQRRVNYTLRSASLNVYDPGTMSDDGYVNLVYLTGTDYGDTLPSFGSAGQNADMFLRLGSSVDVENSANTSIFADGDDIHQTDDEDGITFVSGTTLVRGSIGTVEVAVNNRRQDGAIVEGWIDFNFDGEFHESTEKLAGFGLTFNQQNGMQFQTDSFAIPGDAICGDTVARFRLTTESAGAAADSNGIGETEDYPVTISCDEIEIPDNFDYGDAPESYGDAMHRILDGMSLGDTVDSEQLPLSTADASGDDITGFDDEDGIFFPGGSTGYLGQTVGIEVFARNSVHLDAWVSAWVDWNQNGVFEDGDEVIFSNELVSLSAETQLIEKQITVPMNAACDETFIRVRIATEPVGPSEPTLTGETEDIMFDVDCSVEQGVRVIPSLSEVQLEETLGLLVEADNTGPNIAPNSVVTLSLPVGLDIKSMTPQGGWICSLENSNTQVSCTLTSMPIIGFAPVVELHVRVPGIYSLRNVSGIAEISSDFPERVGEEADNNAEYDVPVVKEWTGQGSPTSILKPYSHVIFDSALAIAGESEADFEINEMISNPFQVPVVVLPGLELPDLPELTAMFCTTHDTDDCTTADAILTGTVRVNSYSVDTFILQTVDVDSGLPEDAAGASNHITDVKVVEYGAADQGRFLETDLSRCMYWVSLMSSGNCMARYDLYQTFADDAQYVWGSEEYIEVILQSNGGNPIQCSGAAGDCITVSDARPGLYRLSGVIQGQMIFSDPVHFRLGEDDPYIIDFEYPYDIYIRSVGKFLEPTTGD